MQALQTQDVLEIFSNIDSLFTDDVTNAFPKSTHNTKDTGIHDDHVFSNNNNHILEDTAAIGTNNDDTVVYEDEMHFHNRSTNQHTPDCNGIPYEQKIAETELVIYPVAAATSNYVSDGIRDINSVRRSSNVSVSYNTADESEGEYNQNDKVGVARTSSPTYSSDDDSCNSESSNDEKDDASYSTDGKEKCVIEPATNDAHGDREEDGYSDDSAHNDDTGVSERACVQVVNEREEDSYSDDSAHENDDTGVIECAGQEVVNEREEDSYSDDSAHEDETCTALEDRMRGGGLLSEEADMFLSNEVTLNLVPIYLRGGISNIGLKRWLGHTLALLYTSQTGLQANELWPILESIHESENSAEQDTTNLIEKGNWRFSNESSTN